MIQLKQVSVTYPGATPALRDISLQIGREEKVALIGANGAGKSTLLLSLVGMIQPEQGEILIDGMSLSKANIGKIRQKIGMVFQNPDNQLFMNSVYQDIAFGPRNYGLSETQIDARVTRIMEKLSISHLAERPPHRLSGGEKRRAALAGVLAMEPQMLLLDEPATFLDPKARRLLIAVLGDLPQGMLLATHDLDMAKQLTKRALVMKDGQIFADGDSGEILENTSLLLKAGL